MSMVSGITVVDSSNPFELDISRRALRFTGNAYDITRLRTACDETLKKFEHKHLDPLSKQNVVVHAPLEDEQ